MSIVDWKDTVTSMSDKVFPGLSHKIDDNSGIKNEVMSNLPLQMALYFNVIFMPFWLSVLVVFLIDKYHCYSELYKFLVVTIITAVIFVEILRLYLGYEGNLRDKIPELAGFWMLSFFLQFPLQGLFLFNPYFKLQLTVITVQSIMFIFLCVQIISGYCALTYTAKKQVIYNRIMKLRYDASLFKELNKS